MKRLNFYGAACVIALLGAGPAAWAANGTDPASQQEGFECIIDLSVLSLPASYAGPTSISIIPPTSGTTSRLCTGSAPNENIKLTCNGTVPDWPSVTASASGFTCLIDTTACDVPGVTGLVESTGASLSVDEYGSASLICHWNP